MRHFRSPSSRSSTDSIPLLPLHRSPRPEPDLDADDPLYADDPEEAGRRRPLRDVSNGRSSGRGSRSKQHRKGGENMPIPASILLPPPPSTVAQSYYAVPNTSPATTDALHALARQAAHQQRRLQSLLDQQSAGLMAGLGGGTSGDEGGGDGLPQPGSPDMTSGDSRSSSRLSFSHSPPRQTSHRRTGSSTQSPPQPLSKTRREIHTALGSLAALFGQASQALEGDLQLHDEFLQTLRELAEKEAGLEKAVRALDRPSYSYNDTNEPSDIEVPAPPAQPDLLPIPPSASHFGPRSISASSLSTSAAAAASSIPLPTSPTSQPSPASSTKHHPSTQAAYEYAEERALSDEILNLETTLAAKKNRLRHLQRRREERESRREARLGGYRAALDEVRREIDRRILSGGILPGVGGPVDLRRTAAPATAAPAAPSSTSRLSTFGVGSLVAWPFGRSQAPDPASSSSPFPPSHPAAAAIIDGSGASTPRTDGAHTRSPLPSAHGDDDDGDGEEAPISIWALPRARRNLALVEADVVRARADLAARKRAADRERTACLRGAEAWSRVAAAVEAVEQRLEREMERLAHESVAESTAATNANPMAPQAPRRQHPYLVPRDGGGADGTGTLAQRADRLAAERGMRAALALLDEAGAALEAEVRRARRRGWRLLVCAVGAELEALREGGEVLRAAVGEPPAARRATSGKDEERGGSGSGVGDSVVAGGGGGLADGLEGPSSSVIWRGEGQSPLLRGTEGPMAQQKEQPQKENLLSREDTASSTATDEEPRIRTQGLRVGSIGGGIPTTGSREGGEEDNDGPSADFLVEAV